MTGFEAMQNRTNQSRRLNLLVKFREREANGCERIVHEGRASNQGKVRAV